MISSRPARAVAAMTMAAAFALAGPTAAQSPSPAPAGPAHFTYDGDTGPEHWADLDPAFAACAIGAEQSPIDIVAPSPAHLADPVFAYITGEATVVDTGHSVQANAAPGSTVTVDGVESPLAQAHFHAPSEHTIDGTEAPVEVHFVHTTAEGQITVVGVMVVEGDEPNAAWDPYISSLGVAKGAEQVIEVAWDAMLPASTGSLRYPGSLTTPPCTEGVSWLVLTEPVALSAAQIDAFMTAYSGNDRPPQPLNERTVQVDDTVD